MSILAQFAQQITEAVSSGVTTDMTEITKGGGGGKQWPEGKTLVRLSGVIELGMRAGSYQGQPKPATRNLMLQFAMYSQGYTYDDGKPGVISTNKLSMTTTEKSKLPKIFAKMQITKGEKHFAELIGNAYIVDIKHTTKDGKTYVNIDLDSIMKAADPLTGNPYDCPPLLEEQARLLLWDKPSQAQWDSCLIKQADGKPTDKQWLHEMLVEAEDYAGSALQQLLHPELKSAVGSMLAASVAAPVAAATVAQAQTAPWEGQQQAAAPAPVVAPPAVAVTAAPVVPVPAPVAAPVPVAVPVPQVPAL